MQKVVVNKAKLLVVDNHNHFHVQELPSTFEARTAQSAEEALAIIFGAQNVGNQPDLILLDVELPVVDKLNIIKTLNEQGCTLPIVTINQDQRLDKIVRKITKNGSDSVQCLNSKASTEQIIEALEKSLESKKSPSIITPDNATEIIGRHMQIDIMSVFVDIRASYGNWVYGSKSKRFYLDCFSYIASNPIGHNHPKLDQPEFLAKLAQVAKTKPANSDIHTVELAEFVDTFSRIAKPKEFKYLFFIDGGTLAVENALKTAFDWKVKKNFQRGVKEELGTKILHFKQAFHGRSGYCLSLTNTADPRKTNFFPKFSWPRVTNPKIQFPLEDNLESVIAEEKKALKEIKKAFKDNPNDIAGIIIEPIQGEGGDNHFRPEFHQALRKIADEQEALLIYDEVQSGVGLTGKMWAYQHYGMTPDIVCFGKKMQTCGIMVTSRVDEIKDNVFVEKSRINSTWGGNLTDMIRSKKYLEIIEEDNLVENAREVGEYLLEELKNIGKSFPKLVSNVRGQGLMCAFDLPTSKLRDRLALEIFKRGVIVLKCGDFSIRLRPSLTFSRSEVEHLITNLTDSLRAIKN
jgi:L-lysine 6-transaminase